MATIITRNDNTAIIRNDHGIDIPVLFSNHQKALNAWIDAPEKVKKAVDKNNRGIFEYPKHVASYFAPLHDTEPTYFSLLLNQ